MGKGISPRLKQKGTQVEVRAWKRICVLIVWFPEIPKKKMSVLETHLEDGTITWPPRANRCGWGRSWPGPGRSRPASARRSRWWAGSAAWRRGEGRAACGSRKVRGAAGTGTGAHCDGPGRQDASPCIATDPYSKKKEKQLIDILFESCSSTHHIFKDKGQRLARVYDVVERDDVAVFQFFQQRGLANGGKGSPLLLLQPDLLERHPLVG